MACNNSLVTGEKLICLRCSYEIPKTNSHLDGQNFVALKFYGKISLEDAVAYFRFTKDGLVQRLLHRLKYGSKPEIGAFLGRKYGTELLDNGFAQKYDCIVPVPLHKSKLKRRGYNQSVVFAMGLCESLGLPLEKDLVKRDVPTPTQTRKSRVERWINVEAIFSVKDPDRVSGKRILIVDDVITTGATIESCAVVLMRAGCKAVGVAAIAAAR